MADDRQREDPEARAPRARAGRRAALRQAAVAIVGIGTTPVGRVPGLSAQGLYELACTRALADAGVDARSVDGVITANSRTSPYQSHADALAESLGITAGLTLTFGTGGAMTLKMLALAAAAIREGRATGVLVAAADNLLSGLGQGAVGSLAETGYREFEAPYRPFAPATFALLAARHAHELGSRPEDLAQVAVTLRDHARRTPGAQFQDPLTVDDVLGSPLVASPLHRFDCAPVSDGGGAVVIVGADRAASAHRAPVWIVGHGEGHQAFLPHEPELPLLRSCARAAERAFGGAVGRRDVDVALIYDPFTIQVLASLEALGFCAPGEGAGFVRSGAIAIGGALPVNPHGGLLSYAHPGRSGAMLHVMEAVTQLRGDAGDARQVRGAEVALVAAEGAMLSDHAVTLLATSPA